MKKNTVLITGAAGFIGSRLTALLLERGYPCIGVDDLSVGCAPLPPHVNLAFRVQDICNAESLESLLREFQPKTVVHLAAIHHIPTCEQNPSKALSVNVVGTQHLLNAMGVIGCRKLVFASTGGVYDWSTGPLDERTEVRATDIYTLTKITNEQQIALWADEGNRTAIVARIFNTIGEDDLNGHLIPEILRQLKPNGGPAVLRLGNLHTRRDYIYVDDTAACLAEMVQAGHLHGVEAFNVGTGREYDVRTVAACLARIKGCEVLLTSDPAKARRVDRTTQVADTRKAANELKWNAQYDLQSALELVVSRTKL